MFAIAQSEELQRRRFSVVADAGGDREAGSSHDHSAVRSRAGLEHGSRFQVAGIEQRDAGTAAVGDQDLSAVSDGAGHARKSRQRRKVQAGVVVDHLDAIARGVCNKDAPALGIEGGVIELAARGTWYGDGSDYFQRHGGLTAPRALSVALKTIGEWEKRKPAPVSSTRNLLEHRVLRRAWTKDRLMGSLHVPGSTKLVRREHSRKTHIMDRERSVPARSATSPRAEEASTLPCGMSRRQFFHRA